MCYCVTHSYIYLIYKLLTASGVYKPYQPLAHLACDKLPLKHSSRKRTIFREIEACNTEEN